MGADPSRPSGAHGPAGTPVSGARFCVLSRSWCLFKEAGSGSQQAGQRLEREALKVSERPGWSVGAAGRLGLSRISTSMAACPGTEGTTAWRPQYDLGASSHHRPTQPGKSDQDLRPVPANSCSQSSHCRGILPWLCLDSHPHHLPYLARPPAAVEECGLAVIVEGEVGALREGPQRR